MKRKTNKIKDKASEGRSPPKAKVVRSNRAGCTTLNLPSRGETTEIPSGYEVVERIAFKDFQPRLTLFIRQTNASSFEIRLKSRRGVKHAPRSA